MLGLKLKTDPKWANIASGNIHEIMTDHAWCEQKAASNAISLITLNPDKIDLVNQLTEIAMEELEHFKMVKDLMQARGLELGRERKDDYVNQLFKFCRKGGSAEESLIDRLLFSAMIEARSCERFKVLSENVEDKQLASFYYELMKSEAGHYTTFIKLAKNYADKIDVDNRWKEWLDFEGELIQNYGKKETIHG
ncbi:tRNA-(ms[2]io[6]A)-hydroxylase [Paracrocinitomix mangrovi]|uniref:tRNA-(ms[2]io[6]A)-hydroxylase n=1 Tax=Paracrocinitomix mangrovi TaxID=2862509 RepID=UPI001C8E204C|nr:tRNA-(ms[2]io[6]A)-hydroxylase [Paracrocinitomix mangrovi]UKN00517.1 tRNA-(ms[2]io[6]A)-hydroxylase [Paracrocinitomix mangrovi]